MKKIEVLGTGCSKCKKLFEATEKAIAELGMQAELVKMTPALVVDGNVKSVGKLPSVDEIKTMIA
jgi:protein-disulfide isomerase